MIGFLRFSRFARITAWFTCFTVLLLVTGCGGGGGSKSSGDTSSGSTYTAPTTNGGSDAATAAAQGRLTWLRGADISSGQNLSYTSTGTNVYDVAYVQDVNNQITTYFMTRLQDGSAGQLALISTHPAIYGAAGLQVGDIKYLELDDAGRPAKAYSDDSSKGYVAFSWVSQQEVVLQFFDQTRKEVARSRITGSDGTTATVTPVDLSTPLPTRMAALSRSSARGRGLLDNFRKFTSDVAALGTFVKNTIVPAVGAGGLVGVGVYALLGIAGAVAAVPAAVLVIAGAAAFAVATTIASSKIAAELATQPAAENAVASGLPVGTYTPPTYTAPSSGGSGSSSGGSSGSGSGSTNGGQDDGGCHAGPNSARC